MGIFTCDYQSKKGKNCFRKPFMECFYMDEESKWGYLCFWHYLWYRLTRTKEVGYARVDTDREAIEHLQESIWDLHSDIYEIKKKLGIKEKKVNLKPIKYVHTKEDEENAKSYT